MEIDLQAGGIALSPAIVIGYIMARFKLCFDFALSYVQTRRYCVSPMSVRYLVTILSGPTGDR